MDPLDYYRQLRPVKQYVETHISEPIKLKDVASHAGLSEAHLSRIFHQKTGLRFQDWLRHQRVEYAKNILAEKDATITQLAFAAGFGSVSSLERAFKKYEGVRPRAYRVSSQRVLIERK